MTPLLTDAQVADYLNDAVSVHTIRAARRSGSLESIRVGRRHYHTEAQVDAWLSRLAVPATAEAPGVHLLSARSRAA